MKISFTLIILAINFLIAYFIAKKFLFSIKIFSAALLARPKLKKIILFYCILLLISPITYLISSQYINNYYITYISSLLMGLSIQLFIVGMAYELIKFCYYYDFFSKHYKIIDILFLSLSFIYIASCFYFGTLLPTINKMDLYLSLSSKSGSESSIRIALISDLHVGPTIKKNTVDKIVERINSQNPDVVFIVGDLLDQNPKKIPEILQDLDGLKNLKSTFGTYMVLGNHEHYMNAEEFIRVAPKFNIKMLLNQNIIIGKKPIRILGLNDPAGKRYGIYLPKLDEMVDSLKRMPSLPTIVLAHQPREAREFVLKYYKSSPTSSSPSQIALALSGHTHGGQIFPFNLVAKIKNYYLKGLYQIEVNSSSNYNRSQIYVTTGTGYWGPPIRLNARNEIAIINYHY
ncbi:MAG: metallophosphoesterase [Oligoflexia bacterium]|nr:metallophosphoesterase [Oligoflexia bacterium]